MNKLFLFKPSSTVVQSFSAGFTLVELLIAISIMVILTTLIVVNFAGLRDSQKLKIAENELVTNLRKIQNYSLSSRVINNNQAVQYYLLKIDLSSPYQYTVQAMYNVTSAPVLATNVETIRLPQGIRFASSDPIIITRPVFSNTYNSFVQKPNSSSGCALIAYKLPFANTLFASGCTSNNWDPSSDYYQRILNFVADVQSAPVDTISADSQMDIKLSNEAGTLSKTVTIQGVTGAVTFN